MKIKLLILVGSLLLLSACVGSPAASPTNTSEPPKTVTVTLSEFAFESSETTFKAGQTYEFVITNKGVINHELAITHSMDEMDMHNDNMNLVHEDALLVVTQDQLPPDETVSVTVTFPESAVGEDYELACHVTGHYDAGMKLPISITE